MPYQPFATDRSGEIRAQGMLAGGQGLLSGLTGGINALQQKKEEDKANIASIKSFESMMKGLEGIADQLDPKFKEAVDNVRIQVSDPALSNKQRAQIGAQGMKGITELMKIGADVKQQNAIAEQNRLVNQARMDSERAQMQRAQFEQGIQQLEGIGLANNGQIPKEILAKADPRMVSIAIGNINKLARESAFEREVVLEDGSVVNERIDPIRGATTRSPKILSDGTIVRMAPQGGTAVMDDNGVFGTLAQVGGNYVPGSSAERKSQEDAAKTQEAAVKAALRKKDEEQLSQSAYNLINRSLYLVEDEGAGGRIVGNLVPEVISSAASKPLAELRSNYQTLNAQSLIKAINDLRANSPTGATGTGQLSDKEGQQLQSYVAALKDSNDEDVAARNLRTLAKFIEEKTGVPFVEDKTVGRTKADAAVAEVRKKAKSRFSIVPE